MCGKLDYSNFKPYHDLSCDFANDSSDIEVSEIKFVKSGDGDITALFVATTIQGLWKAEEHSSDKLYALTFHKNKYQTYDSKVKAKVEIEPTPFEILVHEYFEGIEGAAALADDTVYSGVFSIHSSGSVLKNIKKMNAWDVIFNLTVVQEPSLLVGYEESKPRGKGGYGGGQKEAEKLKERMAFVMEQFVLTDCKSLSEAAAMLKTDGCFPKITQEDLTFKLIEVCIK